VSVASQPLPVERIDESVRAYRTDIDGLRAIAILSVVLYHAGFEGLPGGFAGVDIFFVISGYLIGGHIFSELRTGRFSYLNFYKRRARRILPAFYAVLLFTIAASLILLSPLEARQFGRSAFAATLSVSNILFWHGAKYFDTKSEFIPLLMTWSLAVEEQFYAIIPLLMVLLARVRRNWTLPAILSVCALSLFLAQCELSSQSQASFQAAFYLLPARSWELGVGLALAIAELTRERNARTHFLPAFFPQWIGPIGLLMVLAPIYLLNGHSSFPGVAALPSVLGTALVIAAPTSFINRRLLSLPPLAFVGRVSYSWYLWHWPLLAFLHILSGGSQPPAASLFAVAAAFPLAVLSYFFIEKPFRRSMRPTAPLLLRYAVLSAAMLAVCGGIWLSHGIPWRYPVLAEMEAANPSLASDPCLIEDDSEQPNATKSCYDASDPTPSVALWGDSHAAALAPGLRSAATAQGYSFVQLTKTSCLPLTGVIRYIPRIPAQAARCLNFNRKVLALIEADRRVRVVILTGAWAGCLERTWEAGWLTTDASRKPEFWTTSQGRIPSQSAVQTLFIQSLAAQIQTLRNGGKNVIVLEDVPNFNFDPILRVRAEHIPARAALAKALQFGPEIDPGFAPNNGDASANAVTANSLHQAAPPQAGVALIDLKPAFCTNSNHCLYRDGGRLLYFDSGHLTAYGANFALRSFRLPTPESGTQ
jgi:peptidoglycan/LPS O-acetylase OafA/YrhL